MDMQALATTPWTLPALAALVASGACALILFVLLKCAMVKRPGWRS